MSQHQAGQGTISPDGKFLWNGEAWVPNPAYRLPKRKKRGFGKFMMIGCGGLVGLFVVISAIGIAVSFHGDSGPVNDFKQGMQDGAKQDSGQKAAPAPSPKAAPSPKGPQTLLEESGQGNKTTESFTAAGNWDLSWSYNCSAFGAQGNFVVWTKDTSGHMVVDPVNSLGDSGQDVEHYHQGGTIYLEIESECSWLVKVTG
jgi:hypothetical protein